MKLFEYFLNYSFYFGFTFALVLYIGPKFIRLSINPVQHEIHEGKINKMRIEYLSGNDKNYIKMHIGINHFKISRGLYRNDKGYINLKNFLCDNNFLVCPELPCRITNSNLPIDLNSEQLTFLKLTRYAIDEHNDLVYLEIDEKLIIGKGNGIFGRILKFALGVLFLMIGIFGLFSFTYLLAGNIKQYLKTGHLPELPNSIDDAIDGWRIIFKKPKS